MECIKSQIIQNNFVLQLKKVGVSIVRFYKRIVVNKYFILNKNRNRRK